MAIKDWFGSGKRETHTMQGLTHIGALGYTGTPGGTRLRRGMWVRCNPNTAKESVGILVGVNEEGVCEVHLTNPEGETVLVYHIGGAQVTQARQVDIPASRVEGRTRSQLAAMGYN